MIKLSKIFILFVVTIMLCSCDKEEYYYIINSYNNVNVKDSTKYEQNSDTDKKGTISFGVSDVEQG